jgi:hypothetical protein
MPLQHVYVLLGNFETGRHCKRRLEHHQLSFKQRLEVPPQPPAGETPVAVLNGS